MDKNVLVNILATSTRSAKKTFSYTLCKLHAHLEELFTDGVSVNHLKANFSTCIKHVMLLLSYKFIGNSEESMVNIT